MASALPPYGWWVRREPQRTVVRGWDWVMGATTLMHGFVTLPLFVWVADSGARGFFTWLLLALFIAAGVGWRVTVDLMGLDLARTWWGLPIWRRHFAGEVALGVCNDDLAPAGADDGRFVWLSSPDTCQFGTRQNADPIASELRAALARHRPPGVSA